MRAEFAELFGRHYGDVLRYARRRVDAELASDVAAETFAVAWRRFDQIPDDPLPWLYSVARHALANELRGKQRRDRLDVRLAAAAAGSVPSVQPDPAEQMIAAADARAALGRLSPRDQEVLQLVAWEGLDMAAAAQAVGCSMTAFKVRLHRARRRLSAALRAVGADPDQGDALTSSEVLR